MWGQYISSVVLGFKWNPLAFTVEQWRELSYADTESKDVAPHYWAA